MFTSLKVVRMALVDCDCSRRSATRARRRVMGTRCCGRSPRLGRQDGCLPAAAPWWARPWGWRVRPAQRSGLGTAGHSGQRVTLGHTAVLAGAGHLRRAQAGFGQQLGRSRHGHIALAATRGSCGRSGRRCERGDGLASERGRPQRAPSVSMRAMIWSAATVSPSFLTSSASTPAGRCGHFEHDLVGLDLDQDFIHRDELRRVSSSSSAGWLLPPTRTTGEP